MTQLGKPCPTCSGSGMVPVPLSEGRGPDLFRLCPQCRNSGGVRSPLSVNSGQAMRAPDVTGVSPDSVGEGGLQKVRISRSAAFAKRQSAYDKLQALAEREYDVAGGRISRAVAVDKALRTEAGRRAYQEYDQALFDSVNGNAP